MTTVWLHLVSQGIFYILYFSFFLVQRHKDTVFVNSSVSFNSHMLLLSACWHSSSWNCLRTVLVIEIHDFFIISYIIFILSIRICKILCLWKENSVSFHSHMPLLDYGLSVDWHDTRQRPTCFNFHLIKTKLDLLGVSRLGTTTPSSNPTVVCWQSLFLIYFFFYLTVI